MGRPVPHLARVLRGPPRRDARALLVYFRDDWRRLIPAGFATLRDRSFKGDPDRRLAWLSSRSTVPAAVIGVFLNDVIEERRSAQAGVVAVMLVIGGVILWLADRYGPRTPSSTA